MSKIKILLDTHILLWALSNDTGLSEKARKIIENVENDIYYSIISLWEVEIKHLAHPDTMPLSAKELTEYCEQAGFLKIPIRENHIFALANLRRKENSLPRKDPFDRMLVCQASTENMLFVTHDALIPDYEEPCIIPV